jgi:hypothetical protein
MGFLLMAVQHLHFGLVWVLAVANHSGLVVIWFNKTYELTFLLSFNFVWAVRVDVRLIWGWVSW